MAQVIVPDNIDSASHRPASWRLGGLFSVKWSTVATPAPPQRSDKGGHCTRAAAGRSGGPLTLVAHILIIASLRPGSKGGTTLQTPAAPRLPLPCSVSAGGPQPLQPLATAAASARRSAGPGSPASRRGSHTDHCGRGALVSSLRPCGRHGGGRHRGGRHLRILSMSARLAAAECSVHAHRQ